METTNGVVIKEWTIELERGLHLIRYGETAPASPQRMIVVCTPPLSSAIVHPDLTDAVLQRPGSSLVVRVIRTTEITLLVMAQTPQPCAVEFSIEQLEI